MKPTDTVKIIGRPTAYHSSLARYVGGATAAIFLSQLMYWSERTDNELGVYKTSAEWEEETGLTYREQSTARTKLKKLGLLVETEKRLQHRIYYKLDEDAFNEFIQEIHEQQNNESADEEDEKDAENNENSGTTNEQSPNDENAIGGQLKRNPTNDESATRYIDIDYQGLHTETTNNKVKSGDPDSTDDLFEHFWSAGLRKVKKREARKVFDKKLKESGMKRKDFADMLVKDVRARLAANQFGITQLHPTTYLNNHRWEDEIIKHNDSSTTSCGLPRTFGHIDYAAGLTENEDGSYAF